MGEHQRAREEKKKALDIYIEVFGDEHSLVAGCYDNLGSACSELGKHQKARKYKQLAIATYRILLQKEEEAYTDSLAFALSGASFTSLLAS